MRFQARQAGLRLEAVSIRLGSRLLMSIDREVPPGEVLTVMGPSGSGKSTLLSFIAGFLPPAFAVTGRVVIHGRDVTHEPPEARGIGLLFQDALLFPHLSVAGNLLIGLQPGIRGRTARRSAVDEALRDIGLAGFSHRDPATLSGGEAARVALMRALLARPAALILDEPFSRLDAALREQVRQLVFAECRKRNLPVLLVTHDADDAAAAGGPILQLG